MARVFDNNVANYMSRTATDLGLNGLTEISLAFWISLPSQPAAVDYIFYKLTNAVGPWQTIFANITAATTRIYFEIGNESLGQFPSWRLTANLPLVAWARVLFTWKRNAINSTDGIIYVNGISTALGHTANGYTASFTLVENSNNLYYGIKHDLTLALNGTLAWVTVWNRQLTPLEAIQDAADPRNVPSGMVHQVELCSDSDVTSFGNHMSIVGALACVDGPIRPLATVMGQASL